MTIEQIYTGCLAQGAYYIEHKGEAAIIDPLREVQPYIDRAAKDGAKIKYIFETHFHADFVSGHVTLAEKTGADIVYGATANPSFDCIIASDNQTFKLGGLTIVALHTPGHTMESTTYLLRDEHGKDHAIFSGDTLFLGDVGRPDLAQKAAHMTQEELAGTLFDSLRNKIMPLADDVIVYPAHGAGSACGKNMMKETVDTLGNQKRVNYALRADMTRDEFIKEVTDGLLPPPAYFPMNVKLNKEGYTSIDTVMEKGKQAFTPDEVETIMNASNAIILDTRSVHDFDYMHIPRSIFIGLDGDFAPWVGDIIRDVNQPLILVAYSSRVEEAITRLSRVGFDNILGYVDGGIMAWDDAGKETDTIVGLTAEEFAQQWNADAHVVDVRRESEHQAEYVENAINIPLSFLNERFHELPNKPFFLHCEGGYRSLIAASILKSRGFHDLINVEGGFSEIKETSIPVSNYVCPSTL